jgi:Rod binding domain-containing protein
MNGFSATSPMSTAHSVRPQDKLTKQVQQWVGTTFFGTLLKQMRESPFRSEMFDGGRGGQAFGAMFDQQLATHMTRGAGSKLTNAIVRKLEGKKAYAKQKKDVATAPGT